MTIVPPLFTVTDKCGERHQFVPYHKASKDKLILFYEQFEPKGAFLGLPPARKTDLISWLERLLDEWGNFLIMSENTIIGHIALDYFHNPRSFELMIFIDMRRRCRGIGAGVLKGLEKLLSNQENREMWVVVQNSNTPAIKCFQKVGFSFTGPIAQEREMVCRLKGVEQQ